VCGGGRCAPRTKGASSLVPSLLCGSFGNNGNVIYCRVDAEWIIEKKDWQQSVLQERSATTPASREKANGGAGPSNTSASSPPGDYGMGARSTGDANAHRPEMDEMRCLLWAHGGWFYLVLWLSLYVNYYQVGIFSGAWIRKGECR
jgi:hypothetical protein